VSTSTDWSAVLFEGAVPAFIGTVVTIRMALYAVNNERMARMDERRIDLGSGFIQSLENCAPAIATRDGMSTGEALGRAMVNGGRIVGMYGRYRRFQPYTEWLEKEIRAIGAELDGLRGTSPISERQRDDFIATLAVIISSTLDWMMLDRPQNWKPSTIARDQLAAQRSDPTSS
jgi:hypothetical protein